MHDGRSMSRAMNMTEAEQQPAEPPTTTVTGQLVKARKLSSRLAFADLVLAVPAITSPVDATVADACAGETIELVLKQSPSLPSVRLALKSWKLGDVVSVPGHFENPTNNTSRGGRTHRTFRVAGPPVVVHAYDNKGGKQPFKPVFALCQPCEEEGAGNDQVVDPENAAPTKEELCKYYTSERRCPRAPRCNYVHTDDPAVRREWFASKRRRAVEAEAAVVGGPQPEGITVSKARRAEAFASFLTDTFDLSKDSLVLDVAGGRGDLCFELSAVREVPCVSVDPRGRKLNKRQRKFLKERHVVEGAGTNNNEGDDGEGGEPWGSHIRSLFHADFFDDNKLRGRVSVVAGLHPDEATEHIVDCALKHRIPFAIVPCCVFPLAGGSMSFEDWCNYLQGKDGRIERDYIDCGGKNLVLYCTFAS